MPLDQPPFINSLKQLRRISIACVLPLMLLCTLLTAARSYAQTATLPPGTNTFNISLQSTLSNVQHFQLAPPYLYTVHDTTFTVYDISDLSAPTAINTVSLLNVTRNVKYSGTLAYLLQAQSSPTAAISNSELWILDLATPTDVITKTTYTMTEWHNDPNTDGNPFDESDIIGDIAPFDGSILISHIKGEERGIFGGPATLILLDLSTSPTPTVVSTVTLSSSIYDLKVYENKYIIGQENVFYGGPSGRGQEFQILNYEDILQPAVVGRHRLKRSEFTPLELYTVEDQTYLYTVEHPKEADHGKHDDWTPLALHIRNLTDPATPVYDGFYADPTYSGVVSFYDQLRPFYAIGGHNQSIAAAIDDRLYLLDRSDPTNLFALGYVPVNRGISEIQMSDGLIAARIGNRIQLYRYAEAATQSRYLSQSLEHQLFVNQMGFFVPQNSFKQPISLTVQTYDIDQTNPITESLYATYPLYRIATIDPSTGDVITPTTPFSLEANFDSLSFGRPLGGDILGKSLSFYQWENGGWQKIPSDVVNGDTPYPTVSAQVDRSGLYTVLAEKAQLSYLPLIER